MRHAVRARGLHVICLCSLPGTIAAYDSAPHTGVANSGNGDTREHCGDEDNGRRLAACERRQGGSGTEAGQAPTRSEQQGTHDERSVNVPAGRNIECRREQRASSSQRDPVNRRMHRDCTEHYEGETRIPVAGYIKEREHSGRADVSRQGQSA